jgi:hypothetical protein
MSDETTTDDVLGTETVDAPEASEEVTEVAEVQEEEVPAVVEPESDVTQVSPVLEAAEQENGDDDEAAKRAAIDRKLARENQVLRKRAKEAEAKVREFEEASLSEKERQERRLQELEESNRQYEARLRESSLSLAVASEAGRLNIIDPKVALKLLDSSSVEWDPDTNSHVGVAEAMEALIDEHPYIVRAEPKPAAPKDAPANPSRRRTRLTREALSNMTDAEIMALPKEDIHAALAAD